MTANNIRCDFLAAAMGARPVTDRKRLSPGWAKLLGRLSGRRAHIGLSRLARYASVQGIKPGKINDEVIAGFIATVRQRSLDRHPKSRHHHPSS